ncbi:MAG: two-component regulator propeller domain-containing protein, partial [Bacteroidales bacterium]
CYPRDIDVDNTGLWIADEQSGLVFQETNEKFVNYYPNGPKTSEIFNMYIQHEDLWVAAGGRDLSWVNNWNRGRIHSLRDGTWRTMDQTSPGGSALDSIYDIVCVISNPRNPDQVFAGSWFRGLAELFNYEFKTLYTPLNSSLEYKTNEGPPVCKIGGLAFDKAGNLWITNSGANNILSVMIPEGSDNDWRSYYLGSQSTGKDIGDLIVDSYGKKWILWRQGHLIVFDDQGTPKNPADDQVKHLNSALGNGNIPGTRVYAIAEDNDKRMWIGSDEGIAVIYSPENVFTQFSFDAQRILIPRNDGTGLADILLEFETITAIAVDGANNKWIGTDRSGVYHLSPDGLRELNHFTTENSPLLSNNITDIAINHQSGEVFFGTAKGIISYKSTATAGGETNNDVYAYPNPVRPGYSGPIAVKGLVKNANFKITDISGSLVYSGRADGGQATWNGNNFHGRRVQSGVYLVFVTDNEGIEKMVTKILFMN